MPNSLKKALYALVAVLLAASCVAPAAATYALADETGDAAATTATTTTAAATADATTTTAAVASTDDNPNYLNLTEQERDELYSHARLGAVVGSAHETKLKEQYPEAELDLFQSEGDVVAALMGGKIDYGFVSEFYANRFMEQQDGYQYVTPWFITFQDCLAFTPSKTELRDKVDEILTRYRQDGTLDAITQKWVKDRNYTMDGIPVREDGEVLRVVSTGTDEPYTFVSNGQLMGLSIELMERVAYDLGMRCEFQNTNFGGLIAAVGSGKADVGVQLVRTEEREKQVIFTQTYVSLNYGALTRAQGTTQTSFFGDIAKNINSTFVAEDRWLLVLDGLRTTMVIAASSFVLGSVLAAGLCRMRRSRRAPVRGLARAYAKLATGIPVLVWLMILYYVILADVNLPAVIVAIICFGLQSAAPLAEIYCTGLDSADKGQIEAAYAMGFSPSETFRRVVLPQTAARVWPLYAGQLTSLIKETSVVGYVAIQDLTKVSDIIRSRTFQAFFPLIATALVYFAVIALCSWVLGRVALLLDPKRRKEEKILKGIEPRG